MIVTAGFDYFFLTGLLGVIFAVTITVVGLTNPKFPGKRMPLLMVLSVVLFVAGLVGAAIGAKYKAGERKGPDHGSVAGTKDN